MKGILPDEYVVLAWEQGRRDPSEDFPPPAFSDSRGIVVRQTGSWQEKALCETVVDSSERIV
jgi:hypothetical protein